MGRRNHYHEETPPEGLLIANADFVIPMVSDGESPLTPLAEEALDALAAAVPSEGEFTYEQAYAALAKEVDLEEPAAKDIIERLYNKGHLYEVEGKLRLTDYGTE